MVSASVTPDQAVLAILGLAAVFTLGREVEPTPALEEALTPGLEAVLTPALVEALTPGLEAVLTPALGEALTPGQAADATQAPAVHPAISGTAHPPTANSSVA